MFIELDGTSGAANGAGGAGISGAAGSTAVGGSTAGAAQAGSNAAGEAGEAGEAGCGAIELSDVSPRNASNAVAVKEPLRAFYSCAPARNLSPQSSFRARGRFAGPLAASYRRPAGSTTVELHPRGYEDQPSDRFFPGELVTGWLGPAFGGPYLWQFTTAVHQGSSARFTDTGQALMIAEELSLGDLDHDGDLDLVTSSPSEKLMRVWHNDGFGTFELRSSMTATGLPHLADFNGDGLLDIAANHLFRSQTGSAFVDTTAELGEVHEVLDADGDGDLDLLSIMNGQWTILLGDGQGYFTSAAFSTGSIFDAKAGDLDGDGDLDFVVLALLANDDYRGQVWLNEGRGYFALLAAGLEVDASRSLALGDLDADGDLDVVMGNWGAAGARNPSNQVWLNDGKARFVRGDTPLSGSPQIVLGDLDGDGDLDAIAGQHVPYSSSKGDPSIVLMNDGNGRFVPFGNVGGSNFQHLALGDLDGDGDLDAVVAQWDWTKKPETQVWLQQP